MSRSCGFQGSPTVLIIASGNAGKLREFTALLADLELEVRPQPAGLEVEETGTSFAANARLKAEAVARATGHWALADDSGLSVDALGGAPGIHSARYAASDGARIERMLRELDAAGGPDRPVHRHARFTAALAVADPSGTTVLEVEGICPGEILQAPRGEGGFGYDPIFWVPEVGQTFAEMDPALKRRLGHRGKALAALLPQLRPLLG
ncbi:RdgB/HAM1 family non-canonical purine NTP pyrophosphatase [Cyanobium sp. Morenito 9A2]|uniref:RdgB/HAM1 family non-canonical purine NTP pyrophosphatase n=1 Tax=Cyanobium sp. Morenito 9A2 TaxID=2823718 RepID=UPI0020CE000F|nr:RdgB/HAM1 family non-canonical purine NTP pyrophosphatase [Cyanobium sp. Morenito 9A2]MCP9849607.1 RdgB/HAM1 family non-canonical purine NTP pyrophosphatase [Cyanobium sp. Morenito 9A2]